MQLKNFKKYCFTRMINFLKVLRLSYPVSSISPARLCRRKRKKKSSARASRSRKILSSTCEQVYKVVYPGFESGCQRRFMHGFDRGSVGHAADS